MLGSFLIFIFLLAIAFQSSPAALFAGAVVGLALSLALSLAIYRLGVRLDLKRFFTIVGAAPSVLHVAAWVLFLGLGLAAFLREAGPQPTRPVRPTQQPAA